MTTTVFLTGATGNWGRFILREFRQRADRVNVIALVRRRPRDDRVLAEFDGMRNLEIVYGDLTSYEDVASCVARADIVLHVGALVSPRADEQPELAHRVNVGSMENIIRAVKSQPNPSAIAVVGIGSVAETGDRRPPKHWGRVGDPLRLSELDEYGQSKVIAEKLLVDSGLPKWAWLRQTGIFYPALLEVRDPIMTHVPFAGVLEWVSAEDSSRLLANIAEPNVPAEFWGGIYNVGGGENWRLTNWEFLSALLAAMGVKDLRKWYDRNWFAVKNFHGQYFTDSDRLEDLIPFRQDTFPQALARAIAAAPLTVRFAGRVPAWIVKQFVLKPLSRKPRGTMAAIRANSPVEISAQFGSRTAWNSIGDWSTFTPPIADPAPTFLDHGYDEKKPPSEWAAVDYVEAASFRGGRLLSSEISRGDIGTPLAWECAEGHRFEGSPRLILTGGHWCPECIRHPTEYAVQAAHNPFLAQLDRGRAV